ncbi:DNA polymerase kappa [Heracleum sosnowskyi]|uniref:DNA polymerase kappa n=1 Tax=Heracleum sosnowskyi TaxID=360622 RepID=A0AAD8H3H0_9APIA|nr:DNA polymerase kappa [Heracleum sosnowskyi]
MEKTKMAAKDSEETPTSRPWQTYHTVFTNAKAGMEGVDKEKVQRIVYEMSKGSKYFENEARKEAEMKVKIENMRLQYAKLTASDICHYQKVADKRIVELEITRDLSRIWLHIDMDAFYAAVETLSNPSLKGKPMAVGGMSMLSTANYEARKFGVRAAMPGFIARKLCPDLIFVPVDFRKYTHYSDLTRKVFQRYDQNFMAASLDEAYLDITEVCSNRGITGGEVAEELREIVYVETGLTCSAGVAPNRLLAKVCSDINKPNGQFILPNERIAVMTFISSLPIRKIGGIGKVTENILKEVFGITTCEEMLQKSGSLCALFSRSSADFFLSVGLGLGGTDTPQVKFRKSISNERTFSATKDEAVLYQKIVELAEMLSADMKKEGLSGRTLTLKLKTASFEVRTRAVTLQNYVYSSEDILKHASKLLKAELPVAIRLMGLRMSHFREDHDGFLVDPTQKTLSSFFGSGDARKVKTDDDVSFGSNVNASLLATNEETGLPLDNHELCCDLTDHQSDTNQILNHTSSTSNNYCVEMEDSDRLPSNVSEVKVNSLNTKIRDYPKSYESDESQEKKTLSRSVDESSNYQRSQEIAGSSSNHKDFSLWVDDYKCSLCGAEIPSNFVEERQDHSDFHLAERLQEEESNNYNANLTLKKRVVEKELVASQGKGKKKKKQSPSLLRPSVNHKRNPLLQTRDKNINTEVYEENNASSADMAKKIKTALCKNSGLRSSSFPPDIVNLVAYVSVTI